MPEDVRDDLRQKDPRLALQPTRTYELPGGPFAKGLGTVNVAVLADFKRGSDQDRGYGESRE